MLSASTRARTSRVGVLAAIGEPWCVLWQRRELIRQLMAREIVQRYRGSYLGALWSFITPLLVLAIYTFVFSTVFQVRWAGADAQGQPREFALVLFAGLIPFNAFAESVSRAPSMVVSVPNYAKRVVFPLEVLPVVMVGSALFQSLVSVGVLVVATYVLGHSLPASAVLTPLAYIPLTLLCLGCGWLLAATGVYIRDIGQAVAAIIQVLVFASPVFYPVDAVPEGLRWALYINPLTPVLEAFRAALTAQTPFDWGAWLMSAGVGAVIAFAGYAWFTHSKSGFSDVL